MDVITIFLKEFMRDEAHRQKIRLLKEEAIGEIKAELKIAADAGDEKAEIASLISLGNIYACYSDFALSDTMYRQALALTRQVADKRLETIVLVNLGLSYKMRTEYALTYSYYQKAIKITRELGDQEFKQKILEHMDELSKIMDIEKLSREITKSPAGF